MFKLYGKNRFIKNRFITRFLKHGFEISRVHLERRTYATTTFPSRYIRKQTLTLVGLLSLTGYGLYWFYYPHNNYPRSVSKPLRNALWQERKFQDFKTSIRFYIDAIDECKRLQMDEMSNDYTGIEIKMAELYEKLNDIDTSNDIYSNIIHRILTTLKNNGEVTQERRDALLKKDLSLVNKIVTNQNLKGPDSTVFNKQLDLIEFHLALVEDEIYKKSPELRKSIIQNTKEVPLIDVTQKNLQSQNLFVEPGKLEEFSKLFSCFKEEYFVMRDLYTETFLHKNNIEQALESKMVTIGWMVLANLSRGQILLSQANLGSLLYMKAENIEMNILKHESQGNNSTLTNGMDRNRLFLLNMATKYYESVIANAGDGNRTKVKDETIDMTTLEAIGLSMYGLGVINLHQGNVMKAQHFLKEALHLSKDIGFQQLFEESSFELAKLQKSQ